VGLNFALVALPFASYNPAMNVREAKDFLVNQAAQQAAIDGFRSQIWKSGRCISPNGMTAAGTRLLSMKSLRRSTTPKNTSQTSQSLCDTLTLALKTENSSSARTWDEAVAELNKGDHYLLVLLDHGPSKWQLLRAGSSAAVFGTTLESPRHRTSSSFPWYGRICLPASQGRF
jgi:hypothetical protein